MKKAGRETKSRHRQNLTNIGRSGMFIQISVKTPHTHTHTQTPPFCLCKQFGPKSMTTTTSLLIWSETFDTLIVFLTDFIFEKRKKNTLRHHTHGKLPSMQQVNVYL